jgi:hypothetical protein
MMKTLMGGLTVTFLFLMVSVPAGQDIGCDCTCLVWAKSYTPCVGDTVEIYALVRDCYCVPRSGATVSFYSTRGSNDEIIGATAMTDSGGLANSRITTVIPGTCQVYGVVFGITIGPTPVIDWSGATSDEATTWGQIKAEFRE